MTGLLITVTICEALIMFIFITRLYKNFNNSDITLNRKTFIFFVLLLSSFSLDLLIILKHRNESILYVITLIIIHKLVLKEDNKCAATSTLVTCALIFLSNNFSTSIYLLFEDNVTNELFVFVIPLIILAIISVPILLYVKNNSEKLNLIVENTGTKNISMLLFYIIILSSPITFSYYDNIESNKFYNLLIFSIIFFSICIFAKHYINSKYNQIQSKIYEKTLNSTIDELRIIKHDYDNVLQAIYGYIATKQYDLLNNYLNYLAIESQRSYDNEKLTPKIVNQPAIYGILSSKYCKALDKKIDFDIAITSDVSKISFNFVELSRILGILLDNAIEASEKTTYPKLSFSISDDVDNNATLIEITNSIENENIDIDNIFKKGVSSKKIKSGIGLWEVKRLIDAAKNSKIQTSIYNNTFSQKLIIENV